MTAINIQDKLDLLQKLSKKYKLNKTGFEDFIAYIAPFESIYIEDTYVIQCQKFAINLLKKLIQVVVVCGICLLKK